VRKVIPVLLAAAVFAAPLHAQASFGVLGGYVSSNISNSGTNGTFNSTARGGFAVGISLSSGMASHVGFSVEPMYIEKGAKLSGGTSATTFGINYVEVPLLLKVGGGNRDTRVFALAGPTIAFKVSCSGGLATGSTGSGDCGGVADDGVKSTDFSLMFGAGVAFNQLSISARYDLGLANISSTSDDSDPHDRNHAFLILAGLHFGTMHYDQH
jgi:hypothetical protein